MKRGAARGAIQMGGSGTLALFPGTALLVYGLLKGN